MRTFPRAFRGYIPRTSLSRTSFCLRYSKAYNSSSRWSLPTEALQIREGYNEWISSYKGKLLTINIDEIDFVGKPEIVQTIIDNLEELNKAEGREVRMIGF